MVNTEEIIKLIGKTLSINSSNLTSSTNLKEIVRDSMDTFELIAVLCTNYNLNMEKIKISKLSTISNLVDLINDNDKHE